MGGWDGKVRDRGGENTQERKHMHRVSGCCAARSQAGRSSGLGEEAMDAGRSHIQSSSRENAASLQARKSLPLKKKKKSKTSPELAKSPALPTTTCFSDGKNPCSDCPYSGLASQHLLHSLTPNSSFSPCPQTKTPVHEGQPCIDVVNGQV